LAFARAAGGFKHLAEESRAAFVDGCLRGSYPEPVLEPKLDATRWYGAYVRTYLERDIRSQAASF